jgi:hypothetical protein
MDDMRYYSLGFDPKTGQATYLFVNPFRTEETESNDLFRDHTRTISPVRHDGVIDLEETDKIVADLARGIRVKMELDANKYMPENIESAALAEFGELYVDPSDDVSDNEPTEESE